jgi:transposase
MGPHASTTAATFTRADRRRLERALRLATLARVYRRLEAVLLVAEGHPVSTAARQVRVDRGSVRRWIAAYQRTRDPAALQDRPRRGRRRVAPELTDTVIDAALAEDPRAHGYRATTWTVPLLAHYLAEHQSCGVSERTLRRRLHELGYRWKRPRYAYAGRPAHRALAGKKGLSSAA